MYTVLSLLLVDIANTVTPSFLSFFRALYIIGRVDRLVLDEAYLLLTAVYYRKELPVIAGLRRVYIPFVYLTGTLSPFASFELEKLLYFTQCKRLRASSDRPNLEYCIQSIGLPKPGLTRDEYLLEYVVSVYIRSTR